MFNVNVRIIFKVNKYVVVYHMIWHVTKRIISTTKVSLASQLLYFV